MDYEERRNEGKREMLYGLHPIRSVLQSNSRRIEKIFVSRRAKEGRIGKVIKEARMAGIPISFVPSGTIKKMAGTEKHQGITALLAVAQYFKKDAILSSLNERSIVLILDRIEDPGNLGSIIRTAAAMGVSALFLSAKGSAGLTAATAKRSAGALELIRVARVRNLSSLLEELRQKNFCLAVVEKGGRTKSFEARFRFPLAIIIGGEHHGVGKELIKKADMVVEIPMIGKVKSLNVAIASGIILYEAMIRAMSHKER